MPLVACAPGTTRSTKSSRARRPGTERGPSRPPQPPHPVKCRTSRSLRRAKAVDAREDPDAYLRLVDAA
jgi:hypothetical protein